MPFRSDKQRRFLYAKEPEVAAKFEAHSPKKAKPKKRKYDMATQTYR